MDDPMDKIREMTLGEFDIRNWRYTCNTRGCSNKPDSEVFIYEYNMKAKKGIITLCLCRDHIHVVRDFMRRIKEVAPKLLIEKDVKKIKQLER